MPVYSTRAMNFECANIRIMLAAWRRPRTYTRIALAAVAITVAATVIAVITWIRPSNAALGQVSIVPDAMFCDGKPIDYRIMTGDDAFVDEVPYTAFELAAGPGTECMLRVVISNPGSHTVRVHKIGLPGMGVDVSPMLRATRLYESDDGPRRGDHMPDAIFEMDDEIEPGSSQTLQFELKYGADEIDTDCRREDYTEISGGLPLVDVSSKGRHRTIEGDTRLVIHGKGPAADECG